METSSSDFPKPESIRSIFTLRYDNSQKPLLPKLDWNDFTPTQEPSLDFIEQSIANSLKSSIDASTKKVSMALSGGIDSTLVLALLRKNFPDLEINALSLRFTDSIDETQQAAKIAQYFDANHKIIYLENFLIELPKAVSIVKLPFWDLHWYHIVKNAKSFSDYLVSGDGGDELFGGYSFRYQKFLSLVDENSTPKKRVQAYLECHEHDWVEDQEDLFGQKAEFSWDKIYETLIPHFENSLSLIEQVFLADYNGKLLYNFNPINSAIHEFFDINTVAPILSNEMISYATHLPSNKKYDSINNVGKIPLRSILSKNIQKDLISVSKQGFSVNTINLWKTFGFKLCQYYLDNSRIVKDGWINNVWIEKHLSKLLDVSDVRYVNKFLGLLAFEIWYRIFVTKEMESNTTLDI